MRHIKLFSVPISITSREESLAIITRWVMDFRSDKQTNGQIDKRKKWTNRPVNPFIHSSTHPFIHSSDLAVFPKFITTPNPEMIVAAQKDPEFLRALQAADLAIADGVGVVWATKILPSSQPYSKPITQNQITRLSGLSLMLDLIVLAAQNGWRVMLVGGEEGIAERAAEQLRSGINLPSRFTLHAISGPPDILHAFPQDLDNLITEINSFSPDLLFVAFGHGKQEKWLNANRYLLNASVTMGVGGALDQIVDPSLRPPAYIDSIGLGWLYRLVREPWRWRRQLALVKFATMVLRIFFRRIRLAEK